MHAEGDQRGNRALQLRPLYARKRHASLQDAVGRARGAVVVVWSRGIAGCEDSVPERSGVPLGSTHLETSAYVTDDDDRSLNRALHPVTWFQEPPIYSPVELRN